MERYLVLHPDGSMKWVETERRNLCKTFYDAIGCDDLENVRLWPLNFCCIVDGCGKVKANPQPLNPYASALYLGSYFGDPLVGPVVFVRIELVDGDPDWVPLRAEDLHSIEIVTGLKVPE